MKNLDINPLLLVGDFTVKEYFKKYFKAIELVKSNSEALALYYQNSFFTIFLNCDLETDNAFEVCREIRENDKKTAIAILSSNINIEKLNKAIPLHLSGCIERPFKESQVKEVLLNIQHDLEFLSYDIIKLKNGYHFCGNRQILYDSYHNEIKLTKNELKLFNILLRGKDERISDEAIEHEMWELESFDVDCSKRLKNLLYNLRKKLPENSISNSYKLGYKLLST